MTRPDTPGHRPVHSGARPPLAVTFGCAGHELSEAEFRFFRQADPIGFVLFRRNCRDAEQTRRLTDRMREAVGRHAPVLIDQEGGRVQRLRPPGWPNDPPARAFGALFARDGEAGLAAMRAMAMAVAGDLVAVGADVNAVPVADLAWPGAHDVIGDRSFGADIEAVIDLARTQAEVMLAHGIMPIVKHLPGHGRASVDSHVDLPVVTASRADLEDSDFAPFKALAYLPWGMTAHIVFPDIDPNLPATQSPRVIGEVIRGAIGFQGVLVSDDLSMNALAGDILSRALASLAAGCDIALHCNGDMAEMERLAGAVPPLTQSAQARLARAEAMRGAARPPDAGALRDRVREALDRAGVQWTPPGGPAIGERTNGV